ncbi:unnamed protein product [Dracunculus medinensis]|uniref:THOC2_N domain-containing protein n=1 Tax=Dracunculus medinensis TaxID=318479 RepID=A0A0N4UGQ9_DRAME|nr:unnamed protein product [Dracunculus medinensis]
MVVSHNAVTDENYPIALNALEKQYGQRENRYNVLLSRLKNIHQIKGDFEAVRQLLTILSQLEAANHDINSEALLMVVEFVLPRGIYSKIIRLKAVDTEWTMTKLRELLENVLYENDMIEAHDHIRRQGHVTSNDEFKPKEPRHSQKSKVDIR